MCLITVNKLKLVCVNLTGIDNSWFNQGGLFNEHIIIYSKHKSKQHENIFSYIFLSNKSINGKLQCILQNDFIYKTKMKYGSSYYCRIT